jgi:hypothetical protein
LGRFFPGEKLKRVKYNTTPGFSSVITYGNSVPTISIAREGEVACATLPLSACEGLSIAHSLSSQKHLSDTARRAGDLKLEEAAVLHSYLLAGPNRAAEQYYPRDADHYVAVTPDPTVEDLTINPKTYGLRYAPPPLGNCEALFPAECPENSRSSISGRVTGPQSFSQKVKIGTRYAEFAREFVALVVPDNFRDRGLPMDVSEVDELQSKPTQRLRSFQRLWDVYEYFRVKAFQKREPYPTANSPRNISSCPTMHTLKLSCFTLQFKQTILKRLCWYSPCQKPADIARSVQDLAARSQRIVMTDFSRFDGHIGEFLRVNVEKACYMRWLSPDHETEFNQLFTSELNPKARLGDQKYDAGCSRLSGSPLTTDGNTLINAFVQFCVLRKRGFNPIDSWNNIGLVCGDDGLQAELGIPAAHRSRVAAELGLKLTIDATANPGEEVCYLSRVFRDPWTTPASIQDPLRSLSKLHLTVDTTVPLEEAGIAKARGYLVTDPKTPFISNWARCYLRNVGIVQASKTNRDVPYYSLAEFRDSPWPSETGFEDIVARRLGVSVAELQQHLARLDGYIGPLDGMPIMDLPKPKVKIDAVVNGEVHRAGSSKKATTHNNQQDDNMQRQQPRTPAVSVPVPGTGSQAPTSSPRQCQRSGTASKPATVPKPKGPQAAGANPSTHPAATSDRPSSGKPAGKSGGGAGDRPKGTPAPRQHTGGAARSGGVGGEWQSVTEIRRGGKKGSNAKSPGGARTVKNSASIPSTKTA